MRSRNDNDFSLRYPNIARALDKLPNNTITDGEIVALGPDGRPSFHLLQNVRDANLFYYVFDLLMTGGKDLRRETLEARLSMLADRILPRLSEPVRPSDSLGTGRRTGRIGC